MGFNNYVIEKTLCHLNLLVTVYILANHISSSLSTEKVKLLALLFSVVDLEKFISSRLILSEEVSCLFMLAAIVSNALNSNFFSFCKTDFLKFGNKGGMKYFF